MGSTQQILLASAGVTVAAVTWNPADKGANVTLSAGNLTATGTAGSNLVRATTSHSTGKYYWEILVVTANGANNAPYMALTLATATTYTQKPGLIAGYGWSQQGTNAYSWDNGSFIGPFGSDFAGTDVMGCAVDFGASKIWFSRNNVWLNSGNPSAGTGAMWADVTGTLFPTTFPGGSGVVTGRFDTASFSYTAPTGFGSWSGV